MKEYTVNEYNNLKSIIEQTIDGLEWEIKQPNIIVHLEDYSVDFEKILKLISELYNKDYHIKKMFYDNDKRIKIEIDKRICSQDNCSKDTVGAGSDRTRVGINNVNEMIKDCIKNNLFIEAIELIDSKILLKIK
jgi:hypothetical protein